MQYQIGDKVKYSRTWLRNTGQYTGEIPFAVGTIVGLDNYTFENGGYMVEVDWSYGEIHAVLSSNLHKCGTVERV